MKSGEATVDLRDALDRLVAYVEREGYKGYDPYDTLNAVIPFRWFGRWGEVIATQIQKRNPVNIRPMLGIRKGHNPKAMGLFLHAYALLQRKFPERDYRKQMSFLLNWLSDNRSKGFQHACWGYNFGWSTPKKHLPAFAPTVVATGFVVKGLWEYHQLTGDSLAKQLILDAGKFVVNDLPRTELKNGISFSYSPYFPDVCYNASLLGAEILARAYALNGDETYKRLAVAATEFVVGQQHADGHWKYSFEPDSGVERHQVDFHQGYVIDSIAYVMQLTGHQPAHWPEAVHKGLRYFHDVQFHADGRGLWRIPKEYPTEIHNQSQGILTLNRWRALSPETAPRAKTIADWTIRHMQDPKTGHFYYRQYPHHTNRISFMRWSNAWMMLALAELVNSE